MSNDPSKKWAATAVAVGLGTVGSLVGNAIFQFLVGAALIIWGMLLIADLFPSRNKPAESSTPQTTNPEPIINSELKSPIRLTPQEKSINALRDLGYGDPIWIPENSKSSTDHDSSSKTAIQSAPPDLSNSDLVVQDIASTKQDGTRLMLRALILLNRHSWKKGDHRLFEGESPQGISPQKAIPKLGIETDVKKSVLTYCVGLASTEFRTDQKQDNTNLSDNRAIELCATLFRLGYIDEISANQRSVAVGLGERIAEKDEDLSPSRQRAAILVGVIEIGTNHTEADVVNAIVYGLNASGVKLEKYRRADGYSFMIYDVNGPEFHDATSDVWVETPGLTARRVLQKDTRD